MCQQNLYAALGYLDTLASIVGLFKVEMAQL